MGNVGHMVASKSSSKNTKKLNLQLVLNIELFLTKMLAKKIVKDVVHLWRRNFEKIQIFSSYNLPKQKKTTFGFQRISRINP
jgi:hypothetical protein